MPELPDPDAIRITAQDIPFEGLVFKVQRETVRLPDGQEVIRDTVRHPGGVGVLGRTDDGKILLVRQWRHAAHDRTLWEIPAGLIEAGETPRQAAHREFTEETGFKAASMQPLGEPIYSTPGMTDERIHLFLAADLTPAAQHLDADEHLVPHAIPFDEFSRMVAAGEILDAKTLVAFYRWTHPTM